MEHWLMMLRAPFVAVCVLVAEHFVLTYIYRRPSSLQRLTRGLGRSGKIDLLFAALSWVPIAKMRLFLLLATPSGLAVLLFRQFAGEGGFDGLLPASHLPLWALIAAYFLIHDFAHYVSHRLMHRVPFLWQFHMVHHAAEEMNCITGLRVSLFERAFNILATVVLLSLVLGVLRIDLLIGVIVARQIVELVQHSDLPWGYGPLGYIVASPRFHRMHHSNDHRDYDSNFGNLFSFWDFLCGTVSDRYRRSGPAISDTVTLGLASVEDAARLNKPLMALLNGTHLEFLLRAWEKLGRATSHLRSATPRAAIASDAIERPVKDRPT